MQMRLKHEEGLPKKLKEGNTYRFVRNAPRSCVTGMPCYLFNGSDRGRPLAQIEITESTTDGEKTRGFFVVKSLYRWDK